MPLDLSFPRRFYLDMYLSGAWQSIPGAHVLQNSDLTIERGIPNENDDAPPASFDFTLNDSTSKGAGAYNPYNPLGVYFGQLTRNVPIRFGLKVGEDAFTRTVPASWGTSPVNGVWTPRSGGNSVSSNEGRTSVPVANTYDFSYLSTVSTRDVDVTVSVTIDSIADVTGAALEPAGIMLRGQDLTHYYLCRMIVSSAEVVTLEIRDVDFQVLAGPVTISPAYTGQQWKVRAQAEGWTMRFKAWPAASAEPLDWQITASDHTFYPAGWVGVRSGVANGNTNAKPILFRYDDFAMTLPRFEGEATKFIPNADTTMTLKTTAVKCSDIVQRLSQGKSSIRSAMRRAVPAVPGIIAYWPMEDGKFASQFESASPRGTPLRVQDGTVEFANDDSFASSQPLPNLGVSLLRGAIPAHSTPITYVMRSMLSLPNQDVASPPLILAWRLYTTGSINQWIIQFDTTTHGLDVFAYNNTGSVVFDDANLPSVFDKQVYFSFAMSTSGADVNWSISSIEPTSTAATTISSGTATTQSMGRVYAIELVCTGGDPAVVGHLSIGNTAVALSSAIPYVSAFNGDTVAARIARLLSDSGLSPCADLYEITSGSDTMGPLFPDGLLSLLQECANTDHGIMFSPKGDRTISYRRLDSIYDQTPLATLDHSAQQLQPGFRPVNDDFTIRNDVTVQRRGGESSEFEVTTGPNNSQDPGTADGAVGRYDSSYTVNSKTAEQAYASAGWLAHLGTSAEPRFPLIPVDLSSNEVRNNTALQNALLDCGPGDVLRLTNLLKWGIYDPADALVLGYTERFNTVYQHTIDFNAAPHKPYKVGKLDDGKVRLDSSTSTGAATMTTTSTSMSVDTSDANDLWITTASDPGDFPFDIIRTGERMTVTAIVNATSPQTFTVTRSINGVVKTHAAGEKVSLFDPYYLAR